MASLFCLARVPASFPSWRAPPLFFPARSLYTSESILEQTILIFTRGVFVERFSCFHEFAIRRAMGTSLQSGNIGFSSSSFRAWSDGGVQRHSARRTVPLALQCISGMLEIDFGVSDLPHSRFRPGTCLPT